MIKSILTLLLFLYSYDLTLSWELTGGPGDFGMLILYANIILQSHAGVGIFKEEGRGGSGERANNCALFEYRINVPYYYIEYYKLFIF